MSVAEDQSHSVTYNIELTTWFTDLAPEADEDANFKQRFIRQCTTWLYASHNAPCSDVDLGQAVQRL